MTNNKKFDNKIKHILPPHLMCIGGVLIGSTLRDFTKEFKLVKEAKKYELLLNNQTKLNESIKKLSISDKRVKSIIDQDNEINLNNVENIKTRQLKKVIKSLNS